MVVGAGQGGAVSAWLRWFPERSGRSLTRDGSWRSRRNLARCRGPAAGLSQRWVYGPWSLALLPWPALSQQVSSAATTLLEARGNAEGHGTTERCVLAGAERAERPRPKVACQPSGNGWRPCARPWQLLQGERAWRWAPVPPAAAAQQDRPSFGGRLAAPEYGQLAAVRQAPGHDRQWGRLPGVSLFTVTTEADPGCTTPTFYAASCWRFALIKRPQSGLHHCRG